MSGPTIRPELTEHQLDMLKSSAEAKFYRACKNQLKDKYLVLHSISWIHKTLTGEHRDGEADFAIFDPDGGFDLTVTSSNRVTVRSGRDYYTSNQPMLFRCKSALDLI